MCSSMIIAMVRSNVYRHLHIVGRHQMVRVVCCAFMYRCGKGFLSIIVIWVLLALWITVISYDYS